MATPGAARSGVRAARQRDAAVIGRIQLRAWQAAYAQTLPGDALAGLAADTLAARWHAATVTPPSPRHRVLVAENGDHVAGFAATAPATDPDLDPARDGELVALLVDPSDGRRGHGSRLLSAAADHLRADGFRRAVCWLLSTDDVLRRFLVEAGWAADGAYRDLQVGDDAVVRQIRVHTSLKEIP